eukprot:COSAG01_NODE_39797_length_472_cov_0.501340_1_plen_21_part_10
MRQANRLRLHKRVRGAIERRG